VSANAPQSGTGRDWIKSPCVGVCELDARGRCRACRRTLEEIAGWLTYTPAQREAIIADLDDRHAGVNQPLPSALSRRRSTPHVTG
jgi:predicted Fe-S protein YdhL (DUF1289 family)